MVQHIFVANSIDIRSMYRLKKSLGQHFLKDENMCKQIVATIQEKPFTQLLEVGPGAGKWFI
jgi:16S rRNA (adenine1518-N6/adenine1519-N6)-dimethyltransferase